MFRDLGRARAYVLIARQRDRFVLGAGKQDENHGAADMQVIYETRFSYFGRSGWKAEASKDPSILFETERLEFRFKLFEEIALRSLRDQDDQDFDLLVLSSTLMPEAYQKRLVELCGDTLGDRAKLLFKPPKLAGKVIHWSVREMYAERDWIAQVVLDDDDAVSRDFTRACKFEARQIVDNPHSRDTEAFLSFSRGLSLGIDAGTPSWLTWRNVPYTNLGLTLVSAPSNPKNPFNVHHLKVAAKFPTRVINTGRPFYIRAVHDFNDSKANVRDERYGAEEIARQFEYFPLLRQWFDAPPAAQSISQESRKKA